MSERLKQRGAKQFCTFEVEGLYFGLEVGSIQEVIRAQELTPVPMAPHVVRGLINLRSQIITAVDLRRLLGIGDAPEGTEPMNIIIKTDDGPLSLLVDRIGDVLELDEKLFERPPETLEPSTRELIRGAYKLDGRLMLVLDSDAAVGAAS